MEILSGDFKTLEHSFKTLWKSIKASFKELREREKQVGLREQMVEERLKWIMSKETKLTLTEESINKRFKQLSSFFFDSEAKFKSTDDFNNWYLRMVLVFVDTMDGKGLQIFLNDHSRRHLKLVSRQIYLALKTSRDPGKLVLDAVEDLYTPPQLDKFDVSVVRRTSVYLLEQLLNIKPQILISSDVRDEALRIARDWKEKMMRSSARARAEEEEEDSSEGEEDNSSEEEDHSSEEEEEEEEEEVVVEEVLGFSLLVAAYGLANSFDNAELCRLFKKVTHHVMAPEIHCGLGIVGPIADEDKPPIIAVCKVFTKENGQQYLGIPIDSD